MIKSLWVWCVLMLCLSWVSAQSVADVARKTRQANKGKTARVTITDRQVKNVKQPTRKRSSRKDLRWFTPENGSYMPSRVTSRRPARPGQEGAGWEDKFRSIRDSMGKHYFRYQNALRNGTKRDVMLAEELIRNDYEKFQKHEKEYLQKHSSNTGKKQTASQKIINTARKDIRLIYGAADPPTQATGRKMK